MPLTWRYSEYMIRLLFAVICGGLIGYERENNTRSAGLRTHILVCVASALVMITSENAFLYYSDIVNIDPMRMGAQIVSGIGFLGAGTIIKDGPTIRGLTTAACLWAVACVGIAIGIGFYFGAAVVTAIIFLVLILMLRLEQLLTRNMALHYLYVETENHPEISKDIKNIFATYHAKIKKAYNVTANEIIYIKYYFSLSEAIPKAAIINEIKNLDGIISVSDTDRI